MLTIKRTGKKSREVPIKKDKNNKITMITGNRTKRSPIWSLII